MNSSPAKGRSLIQAKIQEVDSGFSQRHQGLILVDRLSVTMTIDTRDQIEILKYYRKFLTIQESCYFSVEIQKWKSTMKIFLLKSGLRLQIQPLLFSTLGNFQPFTRSNNEAMQLKLGRDVAT